MSELTPTQIAVLERLVEHGFSPAAFPLYANAIGIRRGPFAALLAPAETGSLRLLGEPCYLIEGNFSVRVRRRGRLYFVWKKREVEATPELLAELVHLAAELAELLLPVI